MKGFSLLEILLAIALAAIFIPAIGFTLSMGLQSSGQGENFTKAQALAQEDMEAIFYLKSQNDPNWDWTTKPDNTTTTEYYQPTISGGSWLLGAKTTTPVKSGIFTRKVQIIDHPSISHNLARQITVTVSWKERTPDGKDNQKVELVSYVTAH